MFAPRRPLPPNAVDRLAEAVGESPGARSSSSGRRTPASATTRQRRAAEREGRPPAARARGGARREVVELPGVERAEVAGPGFVNLRLTDAFFVEALAEIGEDYGGGSAETPERVQVELGSANPTGPITVASARNGASATASRGCSRSRAHGRARVLLQRRGRADGPLPGVGRCGAARRAAARGSEQLEELLHSGETWTVA